MSGVKLIVVCCHPQLAAAPFLQLSFLRESVRQLQRFVDRLGLRYELILNDMAVHLDEVLPRVLLLGGKVVDRVSEGGGVKKCPLHEGLGHRGLVRLRLVGGSLGVWVWVV